MTLSGRGWFQIVAVSMALAGCAYGENERIPSWFASDPDKPYKIFDAWKSLSTREAALYWKYDWTVLAGQLRDQKGEPLPLTPMMIGYHGGIRGYGAEFRTDQNGFFVVYGPMSLQVLNPDEDGLDARGCSFYACPGYSYSAAGYAYARNQDGLHPCKVQIVTNMADRAFCLLAASGAGAFDADKFTRFKKDMMEKSGDKTQPSWRDRPRLREGTTERRQKTIYRIRVVSSEDKLVPRSIVKFQAYDGYEGNHQIVETNEAGECQLEEYLLMGKDPEYYRQIQRILTIDAQNYAIGPMDCELKVEGINIIQLKDPVIVSGTIVDSTGEPVHSRLSVVYKKPTLCAFELAPPSAFFGTFHFDRIMTDEEFKICCSGESHQGTPRASVSTNWMVLKPGEHKRGLLLKIHLAAAIRGVVVDESGKPVPVSDNLRIVFENGDSLLNNWNPSPEKFGFNALPPDPFWIEVHIEGFEKYRSEKLQLEPGELRFIKIVMKRSSH